jgi:hypothetical protein
MGRPLVGRIGPLVVSLAAPGFLLVGAMTAMLLIAVVAGHPMWPYQPLNLSEAAAVRDSAEVVRQIEAGEDPNASREIRAGFLGDGPVRMTPLEAAVAAEDAEVVGRVLEKGARLDAEQWNRLRCQAQDEEVAALLDSQRPPGATAGCESER